MPLPAKEPASTRSGARDFVIDTAVVGLAQFLLRFRGLIALPLIVKMLGTSQYGVWVQTLALIDFAGSVAGLNLYHPLVRFLAAKPERGQSIYSTLMIATVAASVVVGSLICLVAGPVSRSILGDAGYASHIRAGAALLLCYNVRLMNLNAYRAIGRLKERSVIELLSTFGLLGSISILLWNGSSLLNVFILMAVWESVVALMMTAHLGRLVGWGGWDARILTKALSYALPLLPAGLSIWMLDRGDRLVIGSYLGPKAVGIYSSCYAIAGLLMVFQTPLQITLLPKVAALWEINRASALRYISLSNKMFMTLAVPFVIGLPLVAVPVLARLGNEEIAAGGALLSFLIAAGVMLWGVSVMLTQIFYGAKRTMAVGIVTVAGALLNLILNLLLVPAFGIRASAFSTLLAYFLTSVALYFFCERGTRIDFYWLHIVKCVAAGLLMAAVVRLITTALPGAILGAIVAGVVTYFVALWLVRAIAPSEIQLVKGMFRPAAMAKQ